MPSVALVSGSLVFVALAVAIVPDDFGAVASGTERVTRASRSRLGTGTVSTGDEPSSMSDDQSGSVRRAARRAATAAESPSEPAPGNVVQSIFHAAPKIELPVEPVDPTPQEPPPPAPAAPPPTATIFTLPSPPPPAPTPPSPPPAAEPPSEPQGITGQGTPAQ
jgi:hypothetical protein